jgi:glycosyltransferase involved in cell wall biosynthesis
VTTWYDVSDLITWTLPHLTGIQRTTVGILNGLVARGLEPRLVRFDTDRRSFVPLDVAELPAAVRTHLPWATPTSTSRAAPPPAAAAPPSRRRSLKARELIFGTSTTATELRTAFRDFKAASTQLGRQASRWAKVRFRETAPLPPAVAPRLGRRTKPLPLLPPGDPGAIGPGDVFLSLGASWPIPGHAQAAAALRARGTLVLRMIYDLIPVIKPQWVDEPTVHQVTGWARKVLTESDHVLTISAFSLSEIERYCGESNFPVPPASVVRLGDTLESCTDHAPPLPRFVPRKPFFLCVSTLDVRKNHRLLYDAWQVLAARDPEGCPDLVCLGVPHVYVTDLLREISQDRAVNGRFHLLRGVADAELAWYYRHCAATIYPSRYEGWGLPVAESLGHGRLCLASSATSVPEISRELPEFFDPLDALGLAALVERTLHDPDWVRSREAEIRARFQATSWTQTAGQVLAAIEAARAARPDRRAAEAGRPQTSPGRRLGHRAHPPLRAGE